VGGGSGRGNDLLHVKRAEELSRGEISEEYVQELGNVGIPSRVFPVMSSAPIGV